MRAIAAIIFSLSIVLAMLAPFLADSLKDDAATIAIIEHDPAVDAPLDPEAVFKASPRHDPTEAHMTGGYDFGGYNAIGAALEADE